MERGVPKSRGQQVQHSDLTIGEQQTATPDLGTRASNFSYRNSNTSSVQGLRPGLGSTAGNFGNKISFMHGLRI